MARNVVKSGWEVAIHVKEEHWPLSALFHRATEDEPDFVSQIVGFDRTNNSAV